MAAGERLLLDAGPLVALMGPRDAAHSRCAEFFGGYNGVLLTTEAVLTEAMYLLARFPGGPDACLRFVISRRAVPVPTSPTLWVRVRALMRQYRDLPMDFADATLVALSEETAIRRVFTLDRTDFGICRSKGKPFEIVP